LRQFLNFDFLSLIFEFPQLMTEPKQETCFAKGNWDSISGIHRFSHQAMATTFEIIIQHDDARYAAQAAGQAFDELDRLEGELSRFIENSDISRINNLPAGQPLPIGLPAYECLRLSARLYAETNGAFDVTIGSLLRCWLNEDRTLRNPSQQELNLARQRTGMNLIKLNEAKFSVELLAGPVQVDLGGIGKGYALDVMAELLRDWSIETAVLHGGFSTVLAMHAPAGAKGWPLTLSNPLNRSQTLAFLHLQDRAVSGSGVQKGWHIIDPRTARPAEGKPAAWSCARDGATADVLSTAFIVMSPEEIEQYCARHPDVLAMVILKRQEEEQKDKILHFGPWKEGDLLK
jgi:thiamine biosynthesis lipoprotein